MTDDRAVEALAAAASGGDREALGALYERYADQLLRYITLRTGTDYGLAEDLAATTWERVARGIRSYTPKGGGFPAWLFTIGKNTVNENRRITTRRREELSAELLADTHSDPTRASTHELVEARIRGHYVSTAVRTLSPRQRRCVTLRFYVGLSLADTAATMGLTVGAVKQLQHRALTTLTARLGGTTQWAERPTETVVALTKETAEAIPGGSPV